MPRAAELTIDRLFDAPALAGPAILGVKISPQGKQVAFLRGKPEDKDRLDLWLYDAREHAERILVDCAALVPMDECLSAEEAARRERQRTAALSGVLEYSMGPSWQSVLFSIAGRLYYLDLRPGGAAKMLEINSSMSAASDATLSPTGAQVAFVCEQNLHVFDLRTGERRALTLDGGGPLKYGMAEFVAQEEMDRSTGYWWAPDGRHIAFARVDESRVALTQRFEIAADNIAVFDQRYPAAGGTNVAIALGIVDVHGGAVSWVDLGSDEDIYLARVNWLPDGRTLAVQRQSRSQRRLDLVFADIGTGHTRIVLTETGETWIELNDELTFLRGAGQFIWASSRDGHRHLYLYTLDGRLLHAITAGAWSVDDFRMRAIKGIDETNRLVYFTATEKVPTERHLYRASLDASDPRAPSRITVAAGVHSVTMAADAGFYVDTFSSAAQPPCVNLHAADGALVAGLLENRLDSSHPLAPYWAENSAPEFGTLTAADGQTLHYRLFKPSRFDPAKRYPAIVDVYGGPGAQRVLDAWAGTSFTQILTRAGYVVFQLDNRGTACRGTAFQAPIFGKLGDIEVADQAQGASWLSAQSFVDSARIGVWGWSYGGYMVLLLLCKAPGLFRAGISGAPVTDWTLYDTHYTERYLSRPDDNASGYSASSVFPYAQNLQGSLLLMHGMADDNVLFLHSTKLLRRLQDLGKPFDVMVYPGAKHGLLRQHDGRHAYRVMLDYFERRLDAHQR